jgi:hypothetical protein
MSKTTIDCHKADEQVFLRLQEKVPHLFGRIEYLVGYNKDGKGFLFTRDGNDVEALEGEFDIVWKTVIEALALKRNIDSKSKGESEKDFNYQRIERYEEPNIIRHRICSLECDMGYGGRCEDYIISIPVRKERQGADITAGSTVLSGA